MKRRVAQISRAEIAARTQRQKEIVAETMAQGGCFREAAQACGVSRPRAIAVWRAIKADLGPQAT